VEYNHAFKASRAAHCQGPWNCALCSHRKLP